MSAGKREKDFTHKFSDRTIQLLAGNSIVAERNFTFICENLVQNLNESQDCSSGGAKMSQLRIRNGTLDGQNVETTFLINEMNLCKS